MAITLDGTNGLTTDNAALKLDGTTLVIDDTNDRVGIGTSSPGGKLDVYNSAAAAVGNEVLRLRYTTATSNATGDINFTNPSGAVLNKISSICTSGSTVDLGFSVYNSGVTEAMRIDSAGRVTMPYQPAFSAYNPVNNTSGAIVFRSTVYNNGSHFSTSTGRFTAPVAGAYYFFTQHLANSGGFDVSFNKNGTRVTGHAESAVTTYKNVANAYVIYMNASDYVYVEVWTGTSYGGNYASFTGYLIG